jgi:hypothetical protein
VEGLAEAEVVLGDAHAKRSEAAAARAAYRSGRDIWRRVLAMPTDPLGDPMNAAEAALKLARSLGDDTASRGERHEAIDEAMHTLQTLADANRLPPRGKALLRDLRALGLRLGVP